MSNKQSNWTAHTQSRYVCSWQTLVTNDAKQSSHSRKPPKKKDGKGRGPSGSRVTGMSSIQDNDNAGTLDTPEFVSHDTCAHCDGFILLILVNDTVCCDAAIGGGGC